jgi:hypothetical protein
MPLNLMAAASLASSSGEVPARSSPMNSALNRPSAASSIGITALPAMSPPRMTASAP